MEIPEEHCRLCGGTTKPQFRRLVLGRHDVCYLRCDVCGSLQTQVPTWLDEAYDSSLASSDVGAVQRCLDTRAALWWILSILGVRRTRLLDFGGGTGLLCRLLRDLGIDAWTADRYGRGDFAQTYRVDAEALEPGRFDVLTAFEVLEHFPNPRQDLAALFAVRPKVLVASTLLYAPECGPDWWYLAPAEGQHVFFYTHQALAEWAGTQGYVLLSIGSWQIFTQRRPSLLQRTLLGVALRGRMLRLLRLLVEGLPSARHVAADYRRCQKNAQSPNGSPSE
jgi:hypothetical protein